MIVRRQSPSAAWVELVLLATLLESSVKMNDHDSGCSGRDFQSEPKTWPHAMHPLNETGRLWRGHWGRDRPIGFPAFLPSSNARVIWGEAGSVGRVGGEGESDVCRDTMSAKRARQAKSDGVGRWAACYCSLTSLGVALYEHVGHCPWWVVRSSQAVRTTGTLHSLLGHMRRSPCRGGG